MLPSPATRQPLLLVPDPRAVCLRLLTFPVTVRSPLYQPWHAPSYMLAPEGFDRCGSLRISISLPPSPQFILCILASCGSWYPCQVVFHEKERGHGVSTTWKSRNLVLTPPPTWPYRRRLGYLAPPPPFIFLRPPLVILIPYPLEEEVWGVALEISVKGSCISHGKGCLVC